MVALKAQLKNLETLERKPTISLGKSPIWVITVAKGTWRVTGLAEEN